MLGVLPGLVACHSQATLDWGNRVGSSTYDEVVLEMGPPDKVAELSDGSLVGDWFHGRAPTMIIGFGVGSYGRGGGLGVGQGVTTGGAGRYHRLTFDAEGILTGYDDVIR